MDINNGTIAGRIVKDVVVSVTKNGTSVAKFSIANNGIKDSVSYFEIVLLKDVDKVAQYLKKGRMVGVDCSAKQDRWTGNDGVNHSRVYFVANRINFMGSGNSSSSENPADEYVTKAAEEAKQQKEEPLPTCHFTEDISFGVSPDAPIPGPEQFKDDIPF